VEPQTQTRHTVPAAKPGNVSLATLYSRSGAERWGVSAQRFAQALDTSAAKRFPDGPPQDPQELARYFDSLRLEDLALACACADGDERAWNEFMAVHRDALYAAARAIVTARDESAAKELADSLYAELYGVGRGTNSHKSAGRRPLFDYFHGRSKLDTWLRAILAQRYVDRLRESTRYVSLDGDDAPPMRTLATPRDHERAAATIQLHEAMSEAVGQLGSRDRLAVSLYYLRGKTLAEIGKIFGEHESSVSRRLDRTRQDLRKSVEDRLHKRGLNDQQINLCFDCAEEDGPFDLSRSLAAHGGHEAAGHLGGSGSSKRNRDEESLRIQLPPGAPPLNIPRDRE
jgi:RNA polymerase sigma-70 factor